MLECGSAKKDDLLKVSALMLEELRSQCERARMRCDKHGLLEPRATLTHTALFAYLSDKITLFSAKHEPSKSGRGQMSCRSNHVTCRHVQLVQSLSMSGTAAAAAAASRKTKKAKKRTTRRPRLSMLGRDVDTGSEGSHSVVHPPESPSRASVSSGSHTPPRHPHLRARRESAAVLLSAWTSTDIVDEYKKLFKEASGKVRLTGRVLDGCQKEKCRNVSVVGKGHLVLRLCAKRGAMRYKQDDRVQVADARRVSNSDIVATRFSPSRISTLTSM